MSKDKDLLVSLRAFFGIVLMSHVGTEQFINSVFDADVRDVIDDLRDFLELCAKPNLTRQDIYSFVGGIGYYTNNVPQNAYYTSLIGLSFSTFSHTHKSIKEQLSQSGSDQMELRPGASRFDWEFLRNLGSTYSPEQVILGDTTPLELTRRLMDEQHSVVYTDFVRPLCAAEDLSLPPTFPKSKRWYNAIMVDTIYRSLVERRIYQLVTDVDIDTVTVTGFFQSHILLSLDDEKEYLGLSVVQNVFPHILNVNTTFHSESERNSLSQLCNAWKLLSICKGNRMPKVWKNNLKDVSVRAALRYAMFMILETASLSPELTFEDYVDTSRPSFFEFVDALTNLLLSSPTLEEIHNFSQTIPTLLRPVYLTEDDHSVWTKPYDILFEDHDTTCEVCQHNSQTLSS